MKVTTIASRLLDTLLPAQRSDFFRDLRSTQAAIYRGHVSNSCTSALYQQYISFCSNLGLNHRLQDSGVPTIEVLQVYGHRIYHKHYSQQDSIMADSVAMVWRTVAKTHLLEGHPDSCKPQGSSSNDLNKQLTHQLRH